MIDDLADDKRAMGCALIRSLLMKGRRCFVSSLLSTQKWRAVDLACRMQFTGIFQFAVRSARGWEAVKEESDNSVDPKVLQEMYDVATSDPYGFLFINLQQHRYFRSFKSELKAS